jgi:hypothetical protein
MDELAASSDHRNRLLHDALHRFSDRRELVSNGLHRRPQYLDRLGGQ